MIFCRLAFIHGFGLLFFLVLPFTVVAQDQDSTAVAQDSLLQALQKEMARFAAPEDPPPQRGSTSRSALTTNPDISVIGDLRALYTSEGERNFDLQLEEVELALKSVVDPYARADVFISMANDDGDIVFELEEAYLTTLALPYRLQLKAGKFRSNVGKINQIHPHSLPFPDFPAVYVNFLGAEGLNDQGVSLSWLVPNASFYQDVTVEVTRGPGENESFVTDEGNQLLYTGHSKNFWDLSENTTLEIGLTGMFGPNDTGNTTLIGGIDITYKWKPLQFNQFRSFTFQAESFFSRRNNDIGHINASGFYALASYQLSQRWSVLGRYDQSDKPDDGDWNERGISTTLGWLLTEFQKIEFGFRRSWGDKIDTSYQGIVRVVFVIGTHGAHVY